MRRSLRPPPGNPLNWEIFDTSMATAGALDLVKSTLWSLYVACNVSKDHIDVKLTATSNPHHLNAAMELKRHEIILIPYGSYIAERAPKLPPKRKDLRFPEGSKAAQLTYEVKGGQPMTFHMTGQIGTMPDGVLIPYWQIRNTASAERANMEDITVTITDKGLQQVGTQKLLTGPVQTIAAAKRPVMTFTVMTPKRKIKKGDEFYIYRPADCPAD